MRLRGRREQRGGHARAGGLAQGTVAIAEGKEDRHPNSANADDKARPSDAVVGVEISLVNVGIGEPADEDEEEADLEEEGIPLEGEKILADVDKGEPAEPCEECA